ncbi:MAG: hypothetical protein WC823_06285 [Parcubacteria group bacterium]|jgi:hypothetical protein
MEKKIIFSLIILSSALLLTGCAKEKEQQIGKEDVKGVPQESMEGGNASRNVCREEKVKLPNYGDPAQRLVNCFVQYPGEPTRGDKSYYIVEDICGQFTQMFMENMLGQKLIKIEPPQLSAANGCSYYWNKQDYVVLNLEYLSAENQRQGQEALGRQVTQNAKIPLANWVVTEKSGAVNAVYLILGPQKFISLRPSSMSVVDQISLIDVAAKIAQEIKNYK